MPKTFIRNLNSKSEKPLWNTEQQKEGIRSMLNDLGFYVLSKEDGSLDVYAVYDYEPIDIKIYKEVLDKVMRWGYNIFGGK